MLLLLLTLTAAPAAETADVEVQRAVELYRAFKIAEGIKALGKALQRSSLPTAERARVYVYVGIGEASRGDEAAARRAFEQAFAYDAAVELPKLASPKTRALFEQLKPQAPPPQPAPPVAEPAPAPAPPPPAPVHVETPPPLPPPEVSSPSRVWIAPAAIAVAAGIAGGVFYGLALSRYQQLRTGTGISLMQTQDLVSSGTTFQSVAASCVIGALALAVVAVVVGLVDR